MTENKNICFDSEDIEVEKVTELELIFRMIGEKSYYEIKYKKVGENFYHIGYSSYDVETVLMYKEKYFEIIEKKPTNADRIRNMTDEELAEFIQKMECNCFVDFIGYADKDCGRNKISCKDCRAKAPTMLEWLQSEAE